MPLTDALRSEYESLWTTCAIRPQRTAEVGTIAANLIAARARYELVADSTAIPWWAIALIHQMEASGSFSCHLHNGDPLRARTVRFPSGRPSSGEPPFTWEQSAADALSYEKWTAWHDWSLAGALYRLESYNGKGYRLYHPDVLTPYLWSFSNHYTRGKYTADGRFSAEATSKQAGAAVILKALTDRGDISLSPCPSKT